MMHPFHTKVIAAWMSAMNHADKKAEMNKPYPTLVAKYIDQSMRCEVQAMLVSEMLKKDFKDAVGEAYGPGSPPDNQQQAAA